MVLLLTLAPVMVNLLYIRELKGPYHFPWAHPWEDVLRIFPQTNSNFPFFSSFTMIFFWIYGYSFPANLPDYPQFLTICLHICI